MPKLKDKDSFMLKHSVIFSSPDSWGVEKSFFTEGVAAKILTDMKKLYASFEPPISYTLDSLAMVYESPLLDNGTREHLRLTDFSNTSDLKLEAVTIRSAEDLTEKERSEFAARFYELWEEHDLGPDDIDRGHNPYPWGAPWCDSNSQSLIGNDTEEMAEDYFSVCLEDIKDSLA